MSRSKILITGAGGFVGQHVTQLLAQRCEHVVALTGAGDPARVWPDNVTAHEVDVRDAGAIGKHVDRTDCIVHLAGPPTVRDSFEAAQRYADIHTGGTANMLQWARVHQVPRFVYISSAEVYGQPLECPVRESHRLLARSPYGAAKIGAERFIESFTRFSDMTAIILRPFSIYGPGQTMNSLLGTIIGQLFSQDQVVLADLKPVRDYCYVMDLADAVDKACDKPIDQLATLNIGSGHGTSVEALARHAAEASGREIPILQASQSDRPTKANIMELISDSSLAKTILDWEPQVDIVAGLRETIEAYQVAR